MFLSTLVRNFLSDLRLIRSVFRFRRTVADLLDPKVGCPWDLQQTHASLRRYLVEEAFEAAEEMIEDSEIDSFRLKDELGDVLFQVFLNAELSGRRGRFKLSDIVSHLDSKIRRRHPHVFDRKRRGKPISLDQVYEEWRQMKIVEKQKAQPRKVMNLQQRLENLSFLNALNDAVVIGEISKEINFDWTQPLDVLKKVYEEYKELEEAITSPDQNAEKRSAHIEEEMGDLLFSAVQLCRHLKIKPEACLTSGNKKFIGRLQKLIRAIESSGREPQQLSPEELEALWQQLKIASKP